MNDRKLVEYVVDRPNRDTVLVLIMYNRADQLYHFVNLTHNHICPCGFPTVEDAIRDLDRLKETGEVSDYRKVH